MLDTSKIYTSNNYGKFKIINYINAINVEVEFLSTGYRVTAEASVIRKGNVKDKMLPSVYGVGYIGNGKYTANIKGKPAKAYKTWCGMLERCYCPKLQKKQPTYKGCSTCVEWHDFQVFAKWFNDNYIDGYHLDKDIKIKGNKVYSPKGCEFVSQKHNNIQAKAKSYSFTGPDGELVDIYNMCEFCRCNKLDQRRMSAVNTGKVSQYKGWVKS